VVAAQPFSVLLGARLDAFAPGQVTMAIPLQPRHTQQTGAVHDGVIGYLAANAMIFAGGSALGMPVVVAGYTINYVRPAQGAELVARANAVATAGRQAVCRCEIWATTPAHEVLVAVAQGTILAQAADGSE
jgi:uncharacterized protein (TIGR00369 family)